MFAKSAFSTHRHQRVMTVLWAASALAFPVSLPGAVTEWESSLRRNVAWQVALDNLGFSPGLIDGQIGFKTQIATKEFQRVRGLPVTGELDDATAKALAVDPDGVLGKYTVEAADLAEIGPCPQSWVAKSKLVRLGHESLDDVLAEKFHCKKALLNTLNPGKSLNHLKAGAQVVVPILDGRQEWPAAACLEVNLAEKIIRVIGPDRRLIALFHCSIAANKAKLPDQDAEVIKVAANPVYSFDPKMWPEVKERITEKLEIPPGPRNPVGRFWIGLSLPGYGMHGTPNPELIGKTGSHGCFRLANWDAIRLGKMVRLGLPVRFVNSSGPMAFK
ncbi:MAG TPA: L,D-transpeptidase [Phycisphaerae bacterium]|nr:L,D-transpeptidase [Phycisphaerae bacterium]HRY68327.1 L,D-transpeptidase [Phycisphaerae bacterium]HSA26790.1 L,D-transpeptidase [Phycisphaerae bacterium]